VPPAAASAPTGPAAGVAGRRSHRRYQHRRQSNQQLLPSLSLPCLHRATILIRIANAVLQLALLAVGGARARLLVVEDRLERALRLGEVHRLLLLLRVYGLEDCDSASLWRVVVHCAPHNNEAHRLSAAHSRTVSAPTEFPDARVGTPVLVTARARPARVLGVARVEGVGRATAVFMWHSAQSVGQVGRSRIDMSRRIDRNHVVDGIYTFATVGRGTPSSLHHFNVNSLII
jgi:hypothetical protein